MEITILKADEEDQYTDFLLTRPDTSMVASLLFRDFLLEMTYPSIPFYIMAKIQGEIVGVLPAILKKGKYGSVLNSLPWFGSNPGLITTNGIVAQELVATFLKIAEWTECLSATLIAKPFDVFEANGGGVYEEEFGFEYEDDGDRIVCKNNDVLIDHRIATITEIPEYTTTEDFTVELLNILHQKTRNQVRKAYQECTAGFCISDYPLKNNGTLDFLMQTHRQNMEAVGGPVKDKEFNIIGRWEVGKDCDLYMSRQKETGYDTAALLVAYYNKTVDYWVPAVVPEFRHLNPLHILIFEAMKKAAKMGYKYWNWGGTTIPGMEGVLHFKQRFGGQSKEYRYYTKMLRQLPQGIAKEDLLAEYPFFYVLPFRNLTTGEIK